MTIKASAAILAALASATTLTMFAAQSASPGGASAPQIPQGVRDRVQRSGSARVIVELNVSTGPHVPEGWLPSGSSAACSMLAAVSIRFNLWTGYAADF